MDKTDTTLKSTLFGGIRDTKQRHHWREMDASFSLLGKTPKVVVLPGNDSITPKQANGMCKIAEDLLPSRQQEICGFYYSDQNRTPQSVSERAEELLTYFLPLVAKKDISGQWQPLEAKEAAENMRRITIVTHCYGSRIVSDLDKKLRAMMMRIGYTSAQTDMIERQLFAVHHNPPEENFGLTEHHFSNLYRVTKADERIKKTQYLPKSFFAFLAQEEIRNDEILLSSLSENEQILVLPRISDKGISEHSGAYWAEPHLKTQGGREEEAICRSIVKEVVSSAELIEDFSQLIENVFDKSPELSARKTEVLEYGQDFADDYLDFAKSALSPLQMKMLSANGRNG